MRRLLTSRWAKPLGFALLAAPAVVLTARGWQGRLGVNPVETVTHATGSWTLRFLLLALAITPLRRWTGWRELIRFRRMTGLFAFFYAVLHLLTYVWLDQFFDWNAMVRDVARRRFITAGALAFLAMAPLAATSTPGWIRRLGGQRWQRLHRLVYAAAAAGVVHYWWLVKSDIRWPAFYGAAAAIALLARLFRQKAPPAARPAAGISP